MVVDTKKIKKAVLEYQNSAQDFSKEKIKSDLKEIFSKHNVNISNFYSLNLKVDANSSSSISNYIDVLADSIYKQSHSKDKNLSENEKTKNNSKQESSENKSKEKTEDEKKHKESRKFFVSVPELKSWSEEEIKPRLTDKMLQTGFTLEEINSPCNGDHTYVDSNGVSTDLNVEKNIPLIDAMVEVFKPLKRALEQKKSIEDAVNDKNNHNSIPQEMQLTEDNENKINNQEPNQDNNSLEEDDQLTPEDLDDIMNYGIEDIKTHSEMETFREGEEWERIQSMQANALAKSDDE